MVFRVIPFEPFDPSSLAVINNNVMDCQLDDIIDYYHMKINDYYLKINQIQRDKHRLYTSYRYQAYNPLQRELYSFYVDNYDKIKSKLCNGYVKLWKDGKRIHYKVYNSLDLSWDNTGPNKIIEMIGGNRGC
jgi:hypothetical protein